MKHLAVSSLAFLLLLCGRYRNPLRHTLRYIFHDLLCSGQQKYAESFSFTTMPVKR